MARKPGETRGVKKGTIRGPYKKEIKMDTKPTIINGHEYTFEKKDSKAFRNQFAKREQKIFDSIGDPAKEIVKNNAGILDIARAQIRVLKLSRSDIKNENQAFNVFMRRSEFTTITELKKQNLISGLRNQQHSVYNFRNFRMMKGSAKLDLNNLSFNYQEGYYEYKAHDRKGNYLYTMAIYQKSIDGGTPKWVWEHKKENH